MDENDKKRLLNDLADAHDADYHEGEDCFGSRVAREVAESLSGGSGPAQVATKRYRDNYDSIFGTKLPVAVS